MTAMILISGQKLIRLLKKQLHKLRVMIWIIVLALILKGTIYIINSLVLIIYTKNISDILLDF